MSIALGILNLCGFVLWADIGRRSMATRGPGWKGWLVPALSWSLALVCLAASITLFFGLEY